MKILLSIVVLLVLKECGSALTVPLTAGSSQSSKASEFYIGFMQNEVTSQRSATIPIFITTDEPSIVRFSVTTVEPKYFFQGEVSYNNATTVELPSELVVSVDRTDPNRQKKKGIHVKAENGKKISIIGSNEEHATTDSFVALPLVHNPLQVRVKYTIVSNDYIRVSSNQVLVYSEFLLVGSRNSTKVVISSNNTRVEVPRVYDPRYTFVAGVQKVELTLNSMETLLVTSTNDLSGTVISSTDPIAVFTGHECGQVPATVTTCDHLVEQVPPQHTWGIQFFTAPLRRESGDVYKIASTNAHLTEVNITCTDMESGYLNSTFRTIFLSRNNVSTFERGPYDYCCIESTNPLLVMQLGKGSSLNSGVGDPLLVTIPAVQQYSNNFTVVQDKSSSIHYLNIIVPVHHFEDTLEGYSRIRINNVTASNTWVPILCSNGQICAYGAQAELEDEFATVIHEDPNAGMSVTVYGFGIDVAYGYSAGYNLDPIAFPIVSLKPEEQSILGTPGNVTLIITRRGNIHLSLDLHLTSEALNNNPVSEVLLLSGEVRKEVVVPIFASSLSIATEIITLVLSHSGNDKVLFECNEANITILSVFEIGFENDSYVVHEDVGNVTLTIIATVPNPAPNPISVRIRTISGTAQRNEDYWSVDDIITLAPLQTNIHYNINIVDDRVVEQEFEMFLVVLETTPEQSNNGLILEQSETQIFIQDTDCVQVILEPVNLAVHESDGVAAIKVKKNGMSDLTVSVYVSTKDISTSAHLDYEPIAGASVVFQPEEVEHIVYIRLISDGILENDEQFLLELTLSDDRHLCHNQSTTKDTVTVTILDDDVLTFRFEKSEYFVDEDSEIIVLTVVKEGYHDFPIAVEVHTNLQFSKSSATDGADYIGVRETLTFQAGQVNHSIAISIIDNDISEDTEQFIASLNSSMNGVQIHSPQNTVINILDNDVVEIGINETVYSVGEGEGEIQVEVHTKGLLERMIQVLFSTKDGSATESTDYTKHTEVIEFGPGLNVVAVSLLILPDNKYESLESFTVELKLLDQAGAKIESGRGMTRIDIIDDDVAVGFVSQEYTTSEGEESIELRIIKQGEQKRRVDLRYEIQYAETPQESSAIADTNQVSVTLDEQESIQDVVLHLVDDNVVEANEVIQVRLFIVGESVGIDLIVDTATVIINDDDKVVIQFEHQDITVSESEGHVVLQIVKVGMASLPLTVIFSTIDNQATDYVPKQEEVTFRPTERHKSVTVDIIDDAIYEGTEIFMVSLRAVSPGVSVNQTPIAVHILDEDDFVTLRFVSSELVVEESEQSIQVMISKVGHSVVPVVVRVTTKDSTAKAHTDYIPVTMEITFYPENMEKSVNISILSDELFENLERFDVEMILMDHFGRSEVLDRISVIIIDSHPSLIVSLNAIKTTVLENEGSISFTVEVIGQFERDIPLRFFTEDNSASNATDYEPTLLSLSLTPDMRTFTIVVFIIDDDTVEGAETFSAKLTSSHEQVLLVNSTLTVTILDDDKITARYEQLEYQVNEEDGFITLLVRKDGQNDIPVTFLASTEDGSAINQLDYKPLTTILTFGPNDLTLSFNISIINDDVLESMEEFHILLSSTMDEIVFESYNASVTIVDHDLVNVEFSVDELYVGEADGVVSLMVVIEGESKVDIHVVVHLEEDSATGNSDYSQESQMIVFLPEDKVHNININIHDDNILEATERFIARLQLPSSLVRTTSMNSTVFIYIRDNDYVTLTLVQRYISVIEDQGRVNLTLVKEGTATIPVNVSIIALAAEAQPNEDYVDFLKTVVLQPNQTLATCTILIVNDSLPEGNESFAVQVQTEENVRIRNGLATILIVDDDIVQVGFDKSQYMIPEESGKVEVCINTSTKVDFEFEVFVVAIPNMASLGVDFTLITSKARVGSSQCVLVGIIDDEMTEYTEDFQLRLHLNNNELETRQFELSPETVTIFILDNDKVEVGFEFDSYNVNEGDHTVVVCAVVKSGHGTIANMTIQIDALVLPETAKIGEDFVDDNVTLLFSDVNLKQCISIVVVDDSTIEMKESLLVQLKLPEEQFHYELLQESTTVVINDNDDINLRFSHSTYSVIESEGHINFEILLHDQSAVPGFPISVIVEVDSNETAADWSLEKYAFTLYNSSLLVSVTINPDNRVEKNESFTLTLSPFDPRTGFRPTGDEALFIILDDDYIVLGFESNSYTVNEDAGILELHVVLIEGILERNISVRILLSDSDAQLVEDFTIIDSALTFSAGMSTGHRQKIIVQLIDDQSLETDESFNIELVSDDTAVNLAKRSAQITIVDNDMISVKFSSDSYSVVEGEQGEVCVTLESGQLNRKARVLIALQSDNNGDDCIVPNMFYVSLNPSQTQSCFSVATIEDNLVEGEETFQLTLSSDDHAVLTSTYYNTAIVHIEDNDIAVFGLDAAEFTVSEGSDLTVPVRLLENELTTPILLTLALSDISTTAGLDYLYPTDQLLFQVGSKPGSLKNITIIVLRDSLIEGQESLSLSLTSMDPLARIKEGKNLATGIIQDITTVTIGFERTEYILREGALNLTICLRIDGGKLDRPFNFSISANSRTAQAIADYNDMITTVYLAKDDYEECVNIGITDDNLVEVNESFSLLLTAMESGSISISPDVAEVTIIDDDKVTLAMRQGHITVEESIGEIEIFIELFGALRRAVELVVESSDGTASFLQGDYSHLSEVLTFPPGSETGTTASVRIKIEDDHLVENMQYFTIHAISMDLAVEFQPQRDNVTVYIEDNDMISIMLESAFYYLFENETIEVCMMLIGALEREVHFAIARLPSSTQENKDYVAIKSELIAYPGDERICFFVESLEDNLVEGVELLQLTVEGNDPAAITPQLNVITINIKDNDNALFGLENSEYTIGDNESNLTVAIRLFANELATPLQLKLISLDISAVNRRDYAFMPTLITFSSGSKPADLQYVTITILPDNTVEHTKTFQLMLYSLSPLAIIDENLKSSTVNIIDQNSVKIGFEGTSYSVQEDTDPQEVCIVVYEGSLSRPVDLSIVSSDETAQAPGDYVQVVHLDEYPPSGGKRKCINVTIIDDNLVENMETFSISLVTMDPAVSLVQSSLTVTIIDNDKLILALQDTNYTVKESVGQFEVKVEFKGELERNVSFSLESKDKTASALSGDYISVLETWSLSSQSVTSKTISFFVNIIDDLKIEGLETFTIQANSSDGAVIFETDKRAAFIFIEDDDTIEVNFVSASYTVTEGLAVEVCVIIEGGRLERSIQLALYTQDNTAKLDADYAALNGSLLFIPDTSHWCINVTTMNDGLVEGEEVLLAVLISDDPAVVTPHTFTTIYIQDSTLAVFALEFAEYTVSESAEELTVNIILLEAELAMPVILSLSPSNVTAVNGKDYSMSTSVQIIFQPTAKPGDKYSVSIAILSDDVVEIQESFQITLSATDPHAFIALGNATIHIDDQSAFTVEFEESEYFVHEDDSTLEVCVIGGGQLSRLLNVTFISRDGSASAPNDYSELILTTSFFENSSDRLCIYVPIIDDLLLENDENFTILFVSTDKASSIKLNATFITILDNDAVTLLLQPPHFAINESSQHVEVSIQLIGAIERDVSFILESNDGTASSLTGDYTSFSTTLVFPSGSVNGSTLTVNITTFDDLNLEAVEYFTVHALSMDAAVHFDPGRNTTTVLIEDNDLITIRLKSASYSVSEGWSVDVCAIVESGKLERTVQLSIDSVQVTAQEFYDYKPIVSSVTLLPNENSTCFIIEALEDGVVEGEESLKVVLRSQDKAVTMSTIDTAVISIHNSDRAIVGLELSEYSIEENNQNFVASIILLEKNLSVPISLQLTTTDETAVAGMDYISFPKIVKFQALSSPGDKQNSSVAVPLSDYTVEATESFQLHLTSLTPVAVVRSDLMNATIHIADRSLVTIGFEETIYYVSEYENQIEVCIILRSGHLDRPVKVTVSSSNGSAQSPGDYADVTLETVFMGDRMCIGVNITDDHAVEENESFFLRLNSTDIAVAIGVPVIGVTIVDNDYVTIGFQHMQYAVSESSGLLELPIRLNGSLDKNVTLTVESLDQTASANSGDYSVLTKRLIFPSGSATGFTLMVTVDIKDDSIIEEEEYFTVHLTSMDSSVRLNEVKKNASIFIKDNDYVSVRLESASYSVTEGETTTVCVKLENGQLERDITLSVFDLPGSAQEDDYSMNVLTFSLSPTRKRSCIPVDILKDNLVEREEIFKVILSSEDPAVLTPIPDSATIHIEDDNDIVLKFEHTEFFVKENDGSITICLTLKENELRVPISVVLSVEDISATNKLDYIFTDTNLVYQPGSKPGYKKNVTFIVLADQAVERTEQFKLNLLHVGPLGTSNVLGNATVNIHDQTVVNVGFEMSDYVLYEGMSFHEVCVMVKRGKLDRPVNVTLFTSSGTAIAMSDYSGLSLAVLMTDDSGNICLDIKIIDDLVVERNELFTLALVSNDSAVHIISPMATIVIIDNDQVTFSFVQSTYTVSEETEQLEISIQLLGGQGLDKEIVVYLESSDENATASSDDYTTFSRALTFPRGSLSNTILPFIIDIYDDNIVEEVEYFTIHITSTDGAVQSQITKENATIFIEDNDLISLIMESSTYSVAEGGTVEVCVSAESENLQTKIELSVISRPISAQEEDYESLFLSLSLCPGESRHCFFVETMDDDTVEGDEAFMLILSSQHPSVTISTPGLAIITIQDDDVAVFGVGRKTYTVGEGCINFTVSVVLFEKDISLTLTLQLSVSDVTATNGVDYLSNVMDVTFVAGSKPGDSQHIYIPLYTDDIVENIEFFQVRLSSVSPFLVIDGKKNTSIVEITDTSNALIGFEDVQITISESMSVSRSCLRVYDGELDRAVHLRIMTNGSAKASADYFVVTEIVIYPDDKGRKCFFIAVVDDLIVEEDEMFTLRLTSADSAISLVPDTALVEINDNDKAVVAMKHSSYTASEGDGELQFAVEIVEGTLEKSVTLLVESRDGNASAVGDFESLSTQLTFTSGSVSGSVQVLTILLRDDLLVEGLESFTVLISAMDSSLKVEKGRSESTIFIIDNDYTINVHMEHDSYSVAEDGTLEVCIIREGGLYERNRQVSISTRSLTAQENDYVAFNKSLILQPSEWKICIVIEIIDDDLVEGNEFFQLVVTSSDSEITIVSPGLTNIQILDNNNARFGFESLDYWLTEGPGIVSIPIVLLEHELAVPVIVDFGTADMSATWGIDYIYQQLPVTFSPGEKPGDAHMIFVAINPDITVEATEAFQLVLSCQNHLASIDHELGVSTIYITDQTTATIGFERSQYLTQEGMPQLQVCLILQDNRQLARVFNFTVSTKDGTAHASKDYIPLDFHSGFGPMDGNRKCLQLTVIDDLNLESDETFSLTVASSDASIFLGSDQTFIRIFDDDQVTVMVQQSYYVAEETIGQVELIVELLGSTERDVSIMLETRDGTAMASNQDYQPVSKVLTFVGGNSSGSTHTESVSVHIQDDEVVEPLEFFSIHTISLDAGVQIPQNREEILVYIISDDFTSSIEMSMPMGGHGYDNDETCTRRGCNTRRTSRSRTTSSSRASHSRSSYSTVTRRSRKSR